MIIVFLNTDSFPLKIYYLVSFLLSESRIRYQEYTQKYILFTERECAESLNNNSDYLIMHFYRLFRARALSKK